MKKFLALLRVFFIGMVAGASPFLCMTYVPSLLTPNTEVPPMLWDALGAVSLLVGIVTLIWYARDAATTDPKQIFVSALGIPAILLATVTNIGSKMETQQAKDAATLQVLAEPAAVQVTPEVPTELSPPNDAAESMSWFPFVTEARAQERRREAGTAEPDGKPRFLVVLKKVTTEREAWATYRRWRPSGELNSERYYPKNLKVFKAGGSVFYVCYTGPLPEPEARRLFKVIRINDPGLSPEVVMQRAPSKANEGSHGP